MWPAVAQLSLLTWSKNDTLLFSWAWEAKSYSGRLARSDLEVGLMQTSAGKRDKMSTDKKKKKADLNSAGFQHNSFKNVLFSKNLSHPIRKTV